MPGRIAMETRMQFAMYHGMSGCREWGSVCLATVLETGDGPTVTDDELPRESNRVPGPTAVEAHFGGAPGGKEEALANAGLAREDV